MLIVPGDSELNTQVTRAGEPELVVDYLIVPKLELEIVLLYNIFPALMSTISHNIFLIHKVLVWIMVRLWLS